MPQAILIAMQIFSFLAENKAAIITLIQTLEQLLADAPGSAKAQAVKDFIAKAMGMEAQMETAWPFVAPIFNLLVATVKVKPASAPAA